MVAKLPLHSVLLRLAFVAVELVRALQLLLLRDAAQAVLKAAVRLDVEGKVVIRFIPAGGSVAIETSGFGDQGPLKNVLQPIRLLLLLRNFPIFGVQSLFTLVYVPHEELMAVLVVPTVEELVLLLGKVHHLLGGDHSSFALRALNRRKEELGKRNHVALLLALRIQNFSSKLLAIVKRLQNHIRVADITSLIRQFSTFSNPTNTSVLGKSSPNYFSKYSFTLELPIPIQSMNNLYYTLSEREKLLYLKLYGFDVNLRQPSQAPQHYPHLPAAYFPSSFQASVQPAQGSKFLQVGLELVREETPQLEIHLPLKRSNERPRPKKYWEEFPASYLDEYELPEIKKPSKKNYRIIDAIELPSETSQSMKSESKQAVSSSVRSTDKSLLTPLESSKSASRISLSELQKETISQYSSNKSLRPRQFQVEKKFYRKTKIFRRNLLFLNLLLKTLQSRLNEIRQSQMNTYLSQGGEMLADIKDWVAGRVNQGLLDIVNTNQELSLEIGQDKKNLEKKTLVQKLVTNIVALFCKDTKIESTFPPEFTAFINAMLQPKRFPPKKYFFKMEAIRLPLTLSGAIGEIDANQQLMILIGLFVIRMLCYELVFICWRFNPNQQDLMQLSRIKKNSIIITSVLHDIFVRWVAKNVKLKRHLDIDQIQQATEFQIFPLSEDAAELQRVQKQFSDYVLIDGLLSNLMLQRYTLKPDGAREAWVDKIEQDVLKFLEQILLVLNKSHQQEIGKQPRERLVTMMLRYDLSKKRRKSQL